MPLGSRMADAPQLLLRMGLQVLPALDKACQAQTEEAIGGYLDHPQGCGQRNCLSWPQQLWLAGPHEGEKGSWDQASLFRQASGPLGCRESAALRRGGWPACLVAVGGHPSHEEGNAEGPGEGGAGEERGFHWSAHTPLTGADPLRCPFGGLLLLPSPRSHPKP